MESVNPLNDLSRFLDAPCCSPFPVFFVADDVSPISILKTKKAGDVRDISGRHVYSIHRASVLQSDKEPFDALILE